MEERIMAYMDGLLDARETAAVEKLLRTDAAWQACHADLLALDASLREISLEEPSLRFTRNTMEQLSALRIAPSTKTYVNKRIIWAITGIFLLLIIGPILYLLPQLDFSQGTGKPLPVELPAMNIDWSKFLNNTTLQIFFIIDAVAALFFLDRYLQRKKARLQPGTSQ